MCAFTPANKLAFTGYYPSAAALGLVDSCPLAPSTLLRANGDEPIGPGQTEISKGPTGTLIGMPPFFKAPMQLVAGAPSDLSALGNLSEALHQPVQGEANASGNSSGVNGKGSTPKGSKRTIDPTRLATKNFELWLKIQMAYAEEMNGPKVSLQYKTRWLHAENKVPLTYKIEWLRAEGYEVAPKYDVMAAAEGSRSTDPRLHLPPTMEAGAELPKNYVGADRVMDLDDIKVGELPPELYRPMLLDYVKDIVKSQLWSRMSISTPGTYTNKWLAARDKYLLYQVEPEAVVFGEKVIYGNKVYDLDGWKKREKMAGSGELDERKLHFTMHGDDYNKLLAGRIVTYRKADDEEFSHAKFHSKKEPCKEISPNQVIMDRDWREISETVKKEFATDIAEGKEELFDDFGKPNIHAGASFFDSFVKKWIQNDGESWARKNGYHLAHELRPVPVIRGNDVILGKRVYTRGEWERKLKYDEYRTSYREYERSDKNEPLQGIMYRYAENTERKLSVYEILPPIGAKRAHIVKDKQLYHEAKRNISPRVNVEEWNALADARKELITPSTGSGRTGMGNARAAFEEHFKKILNLDDTALDMLIGSLSKDEKDVIKIIARSVPEGANIVWANDVSPFGLLLYTWYFIFESRPLANAQIEILRKLSSDKKENTIDAILSLHVKLAEVIHPGGYLRTNPALAYVAPSETIYHGDTVSSIFLTPRTAARVISNLSMRFEFVEGGISRELCKMAMQLMSEPVEPDGLGKIAIERMQTLVKAFIPKLTGSAEPIPPFIEKMMGVWQLAVNKINSFHDEKADADMTGFIPVGGNTEFASNAALRGSAVCRHKAMAYAAAFQMAGFKAQLMEGDAGDWGFGPHAWVLIEMEPGKFLIFDPQWEHYGWVTSIKSDGSMVWMVMHDAVKDEDISYQHFPEMPNFTARSIR